MIVIPGRIPIIIHPLFWLFAWLIGWLNSPTLSGSLIWMAIIFVSVLVHELGHALAAVFFKQKTQIQLIPLGGLTSYEGPTLRLWQQFIITFTGPLFGFFLFLLSTFLLSSHFFSSPITLAILKATQMANLFWTAVNLLPVLPLDGGQLLRIILEALFGVRGFKAALLIGAILSLLFALLFFMINQLLAGALFFLFAFQGFSSWYKSRIAVREDREEENRQLMLQIESALAEGKKEEAKELIEKIRSKAVGGLLFLTATQYLAHLLVQEGKRKEAYDILVSIQPHLEDNFRLLLHELASEAKNHQIVADLSSDCYALSSTQAVALRNARAFAALKQPKPSGGWLLAAWQLGPLDLKMILGEECFFFVKDSPDFKEFLEKMGDL